MALLGVDRSDLAVIEVSEATVHSFARPAAPVLCF
jgi:hypothetical protein